MAVTRRDFTRQALASTAVAWLPGVGATSASSSDVPWQPFAAQVQRLLTALQALGDPIANSDAETVRSALSVGNESAIPTITNVLDRSVLLDVRINPETRVSVERGAAPPVLLQNGWRTFLIKVRNEAEITTALTIRSPQGGANGRRSSLAITGVHDFTNGAVDAVEARARWIALAPYELPPMTHTLSGLGLEYRILQLYSRDAGQREASLQADAGLGEKDLGFRSTLPVLFRCLPARSVRVQVRDEHGRPTTASMLITDDQGRVYPVQGKRELPDLAFEPQIYRSDSETFTLADGNYTVEYGRGPEYVRKQLPLNISSANASLTADLDRWIEPSRFGYYSGDTHIHAAGCSHYESPSEGVTPEVMARQVAGEALDLGSVLNWGPGFDYQKQFFSGHVLADEHTRTQAAARASSSLLRYDVEVSGFPSSHCGHLVLLRLQQDLYPNTRTIDDWPSWNLPILRWAKAQGAITGYAHSAHGLVVDTTALPNYVMPPFNSMGANEFLVDITFPGTVDFLSGCDLWPFAELNIWYHTLNCGFRSAFAGETDFPCITDDCVGGGRSYVHLPTGAPQGDAGYSSWLEGLAQGNAYFGDGRSHLFAFEVEGPNTTQAGNTIRMSAPGTLTITAQAAARLEPEETARTKAITSASPYNKPYWHLERARIAGTRRVPVELIVNGQAVARMEIVADGSVQPIRFTHALAHSSWAALRILPSGHTQPVFIEVNGAPVRSSRRSAQWCRQAVDVCWEQKRLRIRPAEMAEAASAYDHARASYDAIIRESVAD